jgi:hypothetical protein
MSPTSSGDNDGIGRWSETSGAREFSLLCGKDAAEVLASLCTFLQALAYAGRSRWEVGYPGWTSLTVDERRILNLIAAAQSDDAKRFETYLRARHRCSSARDSSE